MKFNEEILSIWEAYEKERANEITPLERMKDILHKKFPHFDFSKYVWISELYTVEANLEFSETMLKRFHRVRNFGHPKSCPIYKFIQQPTLF